MTSITANAQRECPACGSPVGDRIAGQCPGCLMGVVLSDDPENAERSTWPRASIIGDYELIRQVGAGGMGVVYEARHGADGARVALKVIRDFDTTSATTLRRFTIEAEAVSRLNHPNIVTVHEIGEHDEQPFLVMDYIDGQSLAIEKADGELLLDRQRTIARLVARISRAVHHAHTRGVIHRDLKPGNILIDADGNPHLTDFGLAKILQSREASDPPSLTGSGEAPGTPSYMSPEQVSRGVTSAASDIYSLGAVLYALITRRPPFRGATPLETFKKIVEEPPVRPRTRQPALHRDLETVCLKCLEKDPRRRYSSAEDLAQDLERFATGYHILARPPGVMVRSREWVNRNKLGAALIASLCAGLAVSLALLGLVSSQRREIEIDRDQAFDDSMQRVSQLWRDTATHSVTISARELSILAGARPVDARDATRRLLFGVIANDGPSSMAQRYARLLTTLQQEVQQRTDEKVLFDLQLLKRYSSGEAALARGEVDLMVVSAAEFSRAKRADKPPRLVAWSELSREAVLFTRTNSITQLTDLRGRSLAMADPDLPLTISAKARLGEAGLSLSHLGRWTNVIDATDDVAQESDAHIIEMVLRGDYEAGVTHRNLFERQKHRGLVMLDRFFVPPLVLAARADLNDATADALRHVLRLHPSAQTWPENTFVAAGPNPPKWLLDFERHMQKASQFDTVLE